MTKAESDLAAYLLSAEYRRLLLRAIAARFSTTQAHTAEHAKALDLFAAAFPAEVP